VEIRERWHNEMGVFGGGGVEVIVAGPRTVNGCRGAWCARSKTAERRPFLAAASDQIQGVEPCNRAKR